MRVSEQGHYGREHDASGTVPGEMTRPYTVEEEPPMWVIGGFSCGFHEHFPSPSPRGLSAGFGVRTWAQPDCLCWAGDLLVMANNTKVSVADNHTRPKCPAAEHAGRSSQPRLLTSETVL